MHLIATRALAFAIVFLAAGVTLLTAERVAFAKERFSLDLPAG